MMISRKLLLFILAFISSLVFIISVMPGMKHVKSIHVFSYVAQAGLLLSLISLLWGYRRK